MVSLAPGPSYAPALDLSKNRFLKNKKGNKSSKISDTLEVNDGWVIFAKPKGNAGFIQDIKKFQKQLKETDFSRRKTTLVICLKIVKKW